MATVEELEKRLKIVAKMLASMGTTPKEAKKLYGNRPLRGADSDAPVGGGRKVFVMGGHCVSKLGNEYYRASHYRVLKTKVL